LYLTNNFNLTFQIVQKVHPDNVRFLQIVLVLFFYFFTTYHVYYFLNKLIVCSNFSFFLFLLKNGLSIQLFSKICGWQTEIVFFAIFFVLFTLSWKYLKKKEKLLLRYNSKKLYVVILISIVIIIIGHYDIRFN